MATTEGITEPPRGRRGNTLYNSYTTRGNAKSTSPHELITKSDDMASARRSYARRPLSRSAPFSERPRASSISLSVSLFLPFSLGLGQSADHRNAPYRNYDCRHCHVTARTARSRINETASKSRPPPALPSPPALHFACSATPGDLSPSFPDIRFPFVARSASRSHFQSVSLISLSSTRDSPPCDRLPLPRFATLPDGIPL